MRKIDICFKIYCILMLFVFTLTGCTRDSDTLDKNRPVDMQESGEINQIEETSEEVITQTEAAPNEIREEIMEPIIEMDWSNYFEDINGAAVVYDTTENCCQLYNRELALTRRSPCSTFKIISSLIALENGIIETDSSMRMWSGERFWNENWNRNIDFPDAFRTSCVWYFRQVIDEIGMDLMQDELNKLRYGNCDISDWKGELNTNNNNPALTGFWIESSLLISPKEQAEVMERIFGDHTNYPEETRNQLKRVMLLSKSDETNILIYGKTGMGMSDGVVIDAWFTGFADTPEKRIYFCVYLGETDHKNVSSTKAKEIAVNIVSAYLN